MARTVPVSITYTLSRNNAEPVSLLIRATVLPPEERRTVNREAPSVDFDEGALVELDDDGNEIGEWSGRLTAAEECDVEREVLSAYAAWLREVA